MKTTKILGIKINHELTINDAVSIIDEKLAEKIHFQVCTTNPEFVVDAQKDKEFFEIINNSYLSLPDGSGIVFALEYLRKVEKIKHDALFPVRCFFAGLSLIGKIGSFKDYPPIYGVELTHKLIALCADRGYTIGLIGGRLKDKRGRPVAQSVNVAKEAAEILLKEYPNLKIGISESNIFADSQNDEESVKIINESLHRTQLTHFDVLFVAFGHNRQEKWVKRNASNLPVSLCIGIGGTLDDIAGYTLTPNDFYSKYNLRWLYRLIQQPWRIKRILKATLLFPFLVFIDTLKQQ